MTSQQEYEARVEAIAATPLPKLTAGPFKYDGPHYRHSTPAQPATTGK